MKFKKGIVTVTREDLSTVELPGLVCNGVAVHRALDGQRWTVSHAASGMRAGYTLTHKGARELAGLFLAAANGAAMPMDCADPSTMQAWVRRNSGKFKDYVQARREYAFS
tara:strand:+ start:325 stop:654 length:330 start_codon:yes stop_codon:yes gene_type:complete